QSAGGRCDRRRGHEGHQGPGRRGPGSRAGAQSLQLERSGPLPTEGGRSLPTCGSERARPCGAEISGQAARVGRAGSEVGQAGERIADAVPAERFGDGLAHLDHRRERSDRDAERSRSPKSVSRPMPMESKSEPPPPSRPPRSTVTPVMSADVPKNGTEVSPRSCTSDVTSTSPYPLRNALMISADMLHGADLL